MTALELVKGLQNRRLLARRLMVDGEVQGGGRLIDPAPAIASAIEVFVEAAVRAERERCAKFVEGDPEREDFPWCGDVRELAAAIRSGEPAEQPRGASGSGTGGGGSG